MTLDTWWRTGGLVDLFLISLEQTPLLVRSLADPNCGWKEGWSPSWHEWSQSIQELEAGQWVASWVHPQTGRRFDWKIYVGDARSVALPPKSLLYIWQDAFSPKKNPELWTVEWFSHLREASQEDVCLVTYSVARVVKDALTASGWTWQRIKASEHKKQWLRAGLSSQ
jgi:tRNA U34 5-methylaminomethyl-2-thiouridine-forming methyltransferase MnmC